ncbi:MAG: hydroxyacid dehydrogenase [Tissierellia bacterium]|nr:hydroxyacid dehydrogenase [Tissierellia bacterium]
MKCLITEVIAQEGIDILEREFGVVLAYDKSIAEIKEMVKDYEILIVRAETPVDKEMIDAGEKLKVIGMAGIGLNHIDVKYAESKGIKVFNVPDGSTNSVAELALGMMLTTMRRITEANNYVKAGHWDKTAFVGRQIRRKTVGIVSMGKIGYRVAELVKALGAHIIVYDPYLKPEVARSLNAEIASLDILFQNADIISVHTPLTPETYHMIGRKLLSQMKPSSYIFNLGRGGIIDEDALYDALKNKTIAGAGVDVLEVEPPEVNNKLFTLDNFIVTCHIGAGSVEAQTYIAKHLAVYIIDYLREELGLIG